MKKINIFKKIWPMAQKYKWYFLGSYAVLLIELFLKQVLPLLQGNMVNAAIYKNDMKSFIDVTLLYTVTFIGLQVCNYFQLSMWQILDNKYVYDLRIKCYEKILVLRGRDLVDINTGDVIRIINEDTSEFHHLFQRYAIRTMNAGIGTIVSLTLVAMIRWQVAILAIILIASSVLSTDRIKRKLKDAAMDIRNAKGIYSSWLIEVLSGMHEVKLFVAEKSVLNRFIHKNEQVKGMEIHYSNLMITSDAIIESILFGSQILFYLGCALFVINDSFTVAQYITVAGYYSLISDNFQRIMKNEMEFKKREVSIERVFSLLEREDENQNEASELQVTKGEIDIRNLEFGYEKRKSVFDKISCHVESGERVGIVGQSGIGKSTFAHILIRFFEPDNGAILIDSQDINSCSYTSIRKNIGIVSQETVVFNLTVKQNICFKDDVADDIIWEILEKVYLRDVVEKLPLGLNTVLGYGGGKLSGGQAQRLSIARLMYKNPKIIILDEATSALDQKSEKLVQKSLDELTKNKTSIIISHRLNSIINTDRVLVFHSGQIVADETCEQLLEDNELFKDLFLVQCQTDKA